MRSERCYFAWIVFNFNFYFKNNISITWVFIDRNGGDIGSHIVLKTLEKSASQLVCQLKSINRQCICATENNGIKQCWEYQIIASDSASYFDVMSCVTYDNIISSCFTIQLNEWMRHKSSVRSSYTPTFMRKIHTHSSSELFFEWAKFCFTSKWNLSHTHFEFVLLHLLTNLFRLMYIYYVIV